MAARGTRRILGLPQNTQLYSPSPQWGMAEVGFAVEPSQASPVPRDGSTDVSDCPTAGASPAAPSPRPAATASLHPSFPLGASIFPGPTIARHPQRFVLPPTPCFLRHSGSSLCLRSPGASRESRGSSGRAGRARPTAPGRAGHGGHAGDTQDTRGRACPPSQRLPGPSARSAAGSRSVPDTDQHPLPAACIPRPRGMREWEQTGPGVPLGTAIAAPRDETPSPGSVALGVGRAGCSEAESDTRVTSGSRTVHKSLGTAPCTAGSLAQMLHPMGLGKPWDDERPGTLSCLSFPLSEIIPSHFVSPTCPGVRWELGIAGSSTAASTLQNQGLNCSSLANPQ